jgi:hypothetical protein
MAECKYINECPIKTEECKSNSDKNIQDCLELFMAHYKILLKKIDRLIDEQCEMAEMYFDR